MPNIRIVRFALCQHVMNVDRLLVEYGATAHTNLVELAVSRRRRALVRRPVVRHFPRHVTFDAPDLSVVACKLEQRSQQQQPTPAEYRSESWR